jgi:hypothetical protein
MSSEYTDQILSLDKELENSKKQLKILTNHIEHLEHSKKKIEHEYADYLRGKYPMVYRMRAFLSSRHDSDQEQDNMSMHTVASFTTREEAVKYLPYSKQNGSEWKYFIDSTKTNDLIDDIMLSLNILPPKFPY